MMAELAITSPLLKEFLRPSPHMIQSSNQLTA